MSTNNTPGSDDNLDVEPNLDFAPEADEPDDVTAEPLDPDPDEFDSDEDLDALFNAAYGAPLHPINWRTLSADDAEDEWHALNEWVNWLRHEFGLPASIIPPLWHRHPELVWELSALHLRWLGCYDPNQDAAAPLAYMADFAAARHRLHEWVTNSGTRLDRDRPTRQTSWPGEHPTPETAETPITNRDEDFADFVADDVHRRRRAEAAFLGEVSEADLTHAAPRHATPPTIAGKELRGS